MKSLIKNYIDLLTIDKLQEFAEKNNINLTIKELDYVLNLIKTNYEDIIKDDTKYLENLKNNIKEKEFIKIKELYLFYKNKYSGYLF